MICGIAILSLWKVTPWNWGTFVSIPTESPQQELMNDDAECVLSKYKNTKMVKAHTTGDLMNDDAKCV